MSDRAAERQQRLRDALRENLKRRKIQSRNRALPPTLDSEADDAPVPISDKMSRTARTNEDRG